VLPVFFDLFDLHTKALRFSINDPKLLKAFDDAAAHDSEDGDDEQTISLWDFVIALAPNDPKVERKILLRAYFEKGVAQYYRWTFHDAHESFKKAQSFDDDGDFKGQLSRYTTRTLDAIKESQKEREKYPDYWAMPGTSFANSLQGKVLIALIYLEDNESNRWTIKDRGFALRAVKRSAKWFAREASDHKLEPIHFTFRSFNINRDPIIKRMTIEGQSDSFAKLPALIAHHFKHKSFAGWLAHLKKTSEVDQVAPLFMLHKRSRSFAKPCYKYCGADAEYAFVLEPPNIKRGDPAVVIAHETLHLFGAADLYNIKGAQDYTPNDIMHYAKRQMQDARIQDATAHGIGWQKKEPAAPFRFIFLNNP
jgi:hypothetical protein